MKTNQIFQTYNRNFLQRLLESDEPSDCDSFSDLNQDVINYSLSEHGIE